MKSKLMVFLLVTILLIALCPLAANATQTTNVNVIVNNNPDNEKAGTDGWINWKEGVLKAVGYGAPSSKAKTQAQARLLARRAAMVDAQRNLLEAVQGVQVDAETTVELLETTSDIIKTKVSGYLKGFEVVSEKEQSDGSYEVVLQLKLNGLDRIINEVRPSQDQPFLPPSSGYVPPANLPGYTGIIIDARGMNLDRCRVPKILDDSGRLIYDGTTYNLDDNVVNNIGVVGYISRPEDVRAALAGNSRAGNAPLTGIRATSLRNHNFDVVISTADADKILAANAQSGFLSRCAIVILK